MINKTQDEIMKDWSQACVTPMVSIRCATYNQESYISQALDSFLMQETTFPFEVVVHDDASTDTTADIIREYEAKYPKIIKSIYEQENQFSKQDGSLRRIIDGACTGKYMAICEGDDYWIDPKKLQIQVDFLESNPDYGMCYTNFNVFIQKNNTTEYSCFTNQPQKYPTEYSLQSWVVKAGYVAPMTWVVKKDLWLDATKQNVKSPDGTYVLFAFFLANSKVFCLKNFTSATYRILQESAVHTKSIEKSYQRFKGLHQAQLALAAHYLNGTDRISATNQINKFNYQTCLKLIIANNEKKEIENAKKWVEKSFQNQILFFIAKRTLLQYLYRVFLQKYISYKTRKKAH